jgi:D-threo-aldose 1-dehydrogenase
MNPTETRKLGNTGVVLTHLGFGTAPLGELFFKVDELTAAATLQAAWDAGIRYYDTAPYYGRGLSEIRVGRFLDSKPRSEFVLSTKTGRWFFPPADPDAFQTGVWAGGLRFDHVHDYSYDGLMRSYEQSHMRLGMNRIDLLIIHDLDFWFHATEQKVTAYLNQLFTSGWRALEELRKHKLIRGIGAGINEVGMMPRFLDMVGLDFFLVALRYTLMEQEVLEVEFPYCERMSVGVVVGGVYNSGITASGPVPGAKYNYTDATPEVLGKVERMQAICRKHDTPLAAAALQFPLAHPIVASVIPGAIGPKQVQQNVESFKRPISSELWSDLKREGLVSENAPTPS